MIKQAQDLSARAWRAPKQSLEPSKTRCQVVYTWCSEERVVDAKTLAQLQADGAALALADVVDVAIVGIESALERLSADGQSRPG